jgi:hypothetical protein
LLSLAAPVSAGGGKPRSLLDEKVKDHPWQDDNGKDGKLLVKKFGLIVLPFSVSVNITLPTFFKVTSTPTTGGTTVTPTQKKDK